MAQRKATPEERERLKKFWGWTDEQIDKLTPKHWALLDRGAKFNEYRMVAEVVEARNCLAGHKKGDKYVYHASGFLLPDESTVRRFCHWAIAAMLPFSYMVYDRLALDADPTSLSIDHIECPDVGVEKGGYGKVLFRMYCEKSPRKEPKR